VGAVVRLLTALVLMVAACDGTPTPPKTSAAERLGKAEAAMEACKQRTGLADVATPSGVVLDDPATRGQALTPELAGQLRLKVQCRLELDELLAARRQ
jgi:hypothetical protein